MTNAGHVPAPAMEAVEYEWKTFENDFFHQSVYRGPPSVELEKAWDELWDCRSPQFLFVQVF